MYDPTTAMLMMAHLLMGTNAWVALQNPPSVLQLWPNLLVGTNMWVPVLNSFGVLPLWYTLLADTNTWVLLLNPHCFYSHGYPLTSKYAHVGNDMRLTMLIPAFSHCHAGIKNVGIRTWTPKFKCSNTNPTMFLSIITHKSKGPNVWVTIGSLPYFCLWYPLSSGSKHMDFDEQIHLRFTKPPTNSSFI